MKNILLLLLFALLSTLTAQDSLYCSIKYTPFKEFVGNVKAGGDLNGDGYSDLVISAPCYTTPGGQNAKDGRVYIYFGGTNFDGVPDRIIAGSELDVDAWDLEFGKEIEICGDYNNDGFDDLAVYSQGANYFFYGHVHIFNGSAEFDTTPDWKKDGQPRDMLGQSLSAGDVNGDGYDDLAFIRGSQQDPKTIELYAGGNTMSQQPVWSYGLGSWGGVLISGDINGDGFKDIVLNKDWNTIIYYGCNGFTFDSMQTTSKICYKVYDLNNDSYSDMITFNECIINYDYKGRYSVLYGSNNFDSIPDIDMSGTDSMFYFGRINYNLGDINKDGFNEIILGTDKFSSQNWIGIYSLKDPSDIEGNTGLLKNLCLSSYPNPFNNTTAINYQLPSANLVKLVVYNAKGELVKQLINARQGKGQHSTDLNANGLNSGVYYLRLFAGEVNQTQKIVLIK